MISLVLVLFIHFVHKLTKQIPRYIINKRKNRYVRSLWWYGRFRSKNEITFSNLIAIANNKKIFQALDGETQNKLIQLLCAYTKENIDTILTREPRLKPYTR